MEAHICNPSIWKAEAGRVSVQGQPGLCSKTISNNQNNNTQTQKQKQKKAGKEKKGQTKI
jgi:hypothetical protein